MKIISICNGYKYPVHKNLGDLERNTDNLAKFINETYNGLAIGLVCQGTSGVLIATRTAAKLVDVPYDIHLIRKETENAHSNSPTILWRANPHLIIVDDVISSGLTLERIYGSLCEMRVDGLPANNYVDAICIGGVIQSQVPTHYFPTLKYLLP